MSRKPAHVGTYFQAAFGIDLDPNDPLMNCRLASACGVACREAIDAGRTLAKSLRATLGEGNAHEFDVCNAVLRLCQQLQRDHQ